MCFLFYLLTQVGKSQPMADVDLPIELQHLKIQSIEYTKSLSTNSYMRGRVSIAYGYN